MSTNYLGKFKKSRRALPGRRAQKMGKIAKYSLILFIILCAAGVTMQVAEVSTPGLAWYRFE